MKKPKPRSPFDPRLFEYFPKEAKDKDVYESMAMRGVSPDELIDPESRKRYIAYLAKNGYST